ncbi:hypothetical protein CP981_33490 [Streptomyces platensis]|uniref:Uncharacterized protein n=1 Tax=Streptomyces platensis TaxID=58346 RepID=A0AAE6TQP6_STRPT|nr:hypothetical protein BG653_07074 [Streptomyces platensis]QEV55875.1 hypothetical protein CP981_33490 [Streptomyces platensis]
MLLVHVFPDDNVKRVGTAGKSDWHPRPEQFCSAFRQNVLRAVRGTGRAECGADSTYRADSSRGTVRTFPMT